MFLSLYSLLREYVPNWLWQPGYSVSWPLPTMCAVGYYAVYLYFEIHWWNHHPHRVNKHIYCCINLFSTLAHKHASKLIYFINQTISGVSNLATKSWNCSENCLETKHSGAIWPIGVQIFSFVIILFFLAGECFLPLFLSLLSFVDLNITIFLLESFL